MPRRNLQVALLASGSDCYDERNRRFSHPQRTKVRKVNVSTKLQLKPGGCILWLEFDPESLVIERFYWFGGNVGNALPDLGLRIARHSKGNSKGKKTERLIHRVLTGRQFDTLTDISGVVEKLFG